MMQLTIDPACSAANVLLRVPHGGSFSQLSDTVFAYVDGSELTALEIIDTTQFGDPFDETAAERAVAWALEQLATRAAS